MFRKIFWNSFFFLYLISIDEGKQLFDQHCNICHRNGSNIILPEKNLIEASLLTNGMNSLDSMIYQITNGKNGMPAFGGRVTEKEIEQIAKYVLRESKENFIDFSVKK